MQSFSNISEYNKSDIILFLNYEKRFTNHSAPVAQLDRVLGYEPRGRAFESLRARHINNELA